MDARFEARKRELMEECTMSTEVLERVLPRLRQFMRPFVERLARKEQVEHACTFMQGLLCDLEHKNTESIAYRFGQERMPLQWFIGMSDWDQRPLIQQLVTQVARTLGDPQGVIVFDPSSFPKSGRQSVGVARQWCGRLGKVDNCQVAVYMGYVSPQEHALVDMRLYLPREWTRDKARCRKAGVPKGTRYRTRHELCLEMLQEHGGTLPHRWIAGDDEMGRPYWFRRRLHDLGEQYLLAVPGNTLIRDLQVDPPVGCGWGRPPDRPWVRVDNWARDYPQTWTKIDVRDGAKGPLIVEAVQRRVVARDDKRPAEHEELLVVIRYKDRDARSVVKTDYYLCHASCETTLSELCGVAKAEHRIEECLQRAKSETGLADYEVRNWKGWHHHQVLSLLAVWFLVLEARRGKKMDSGVNGAAGPGRDLVPPAPREWMRYSLPRASRTRTAPTPQ